MKLEFIEPKIGVRAKKMKARTYAIWDEKGNFSVFKSSKPFKEAEVRQKIVNIYKQDVFKNQKLYEKCIKEIIESPIFQTLDKFFQRKI